MAGILLALLSAVATTMLLLNGYRRTRLIQQQRAALEAQHQATRAAREASVAKDTFLGMISHELRTPLHAIVSSVELLELNLHSEERTAGSSSGSKPARAISKRRCAT